MKRKNKTASVEQFYIRDDGTFPNNPLPVLFYKGVLKIPAFFAAAVIKKLFRNNNWSNSWKYGIYEFNHYHSTTHEVLGVCKGRTTLLLGGNKGVKLEIEKGDVIIIPAGVAHKNLGNKNDVQCVGAYPEGMDYDMNYGKTGERPQADLNINKVPKPSTDPVFGTSGGLIKYWDS